MDISLEWSQAHMCLLRYDKVHKFPISAEPADQMMVGLACLCSGPVAVVMAWIKKRVPVVEYGSLLERLGTKEEDGDTACSVCLDRIKRSHEIRELPNCYPVFHKDCLDTWVDAGQVTCPLCRSMLLPGSS
ncbi:hypothetical protein AAG906_025235 [Vitis piasezkii]